MSLYKKFFILLALVTLALSLAVKATPASKSKPLLDLRGYQLPSGLIQTFKHGTVADPYFGLYAIEIGRKGGLNVSLAEASFIRWGLMEQNKDGTFDRYCQKKEGWVSCGKSDSHDATLARWMTLLYTAAPRNSALPSAWKESAALAESALMGLRLQSGIYSVFQPGTPGYDGYALFKDNVEVLNAFEQLELIMSERGEHERAQTFNERSVSLRAAMAKEFGDRPFDMQRFAVGANYPNWKFYPHGVAIPFGWMEGYFSTPSQADWSKWLATNYTEWLKNAEVDFPWGLVAVAAAQSGPKEQAECWLKRTAAQRKTGHRWNVLEELSTQVLLVQPGVRKGHCDLGAQAG